MAGSATGRRKLRLALRFRKFEPFADTGDPLGSGHFLKRRPHLPSEAGGFRDPFSRALRSRSGHWGTATATCSMRSSAFHSQAPRTCASAAAVQAALIAQVSSSLQGLPIFCRTPSGRNSSTASLQAMTCAFRSPFRMPGKGRLTLGRSGVMVHRQNGVPKDVALA